MAPSRKTLERPSKNLSDSVFILGFFAIVTGLPLGMVYTQIMFTEKNDTCNLPYDLKCSNIRIFDVGEEEKGLIGFAVGFESRHQRGIISKTPIVDREQIARAGKMVYWFGTYDVSEKIVMPACSLTCEEIGEPDSHPTTVSVNAKCPQFYTVLLETSLAYYKYETIFPESLKDLEKTVAIIANSQTIRCREAKAHIPEYFTYFVPVDFSIVFDNPYGFEKGNITKHPLNKEDEFVLAGKDVLWFGSAYPYEAGGLMKSLFSFKSKAFTEPLYFEVYCPELEDRVQEIFREQWNNHVGFKILKSMGAVCFIIGFFVFIIGISCGDCRARHEMRKLLR